MAATIKKLIHLFNMLNSLTLIIFLLCFIFHGNAQTPVSYPYRACLSDNFTQNSTYLSHINLLFSNLTANGPSRNRFFNTSVDRPPNDAVYGLFQCRGDVTDRECRNCLATATRDTANLYCPLRKGAVIWYDECTLRYSNHSFFSTVSTEPSLQLLNTGDIDLDKARFNQLVMDTLKETADRATATGGELFATQAANFTSDVTLYTLAQCTGDLSNSDCQDCLTQSIRSIPSCCTNKRGGRVLLPSCYVRYEVYMFYGSTDIHVDIMVEFNKLVMSTLMVAADRAANASTTSKMFATQEASFTQDITLYTLAHCMSDLTNLQCKNCLTQAIDSIPSCCFDKQEDSVPIGGCYIRYGINKFYEETATNSAPPTPTPMPNSTTPTPPLLLPPPTGETKFSTLLIVSIVVPITIVSILLFVGCCFLRRWQKTNKYSSAMTQDCVINEMPTVESLQFHFSTIHAATNNFSPDNKLGQGGFGAVYKGRLDNGQEIAVKRLSKRSSQGAEEFKNEVMLLAKLQHRNLVRLLGFCLEAEEKILIYEYISNKSLDYFLFDSNRQRELNWLSRYKIINNIARGILYLHEDSRLRIIHRDLKASNILLDEDMNPKISDFGLARIIQINQNQENYTDRIVGTFGYMSPEYAMHGNFSIKSDVYSFGVLTLEIICGKKNYNFYLSELAEDILTYAWKLWKDGTSIELLDSSMKNNYSKIEVHRCIHIALLCVQDDPTHRPSMASIVLMLSSYSVPLSLPKEPTAFVHNRDNFNVIDSDQSVSKHLMLSTNEISVTELHPR